LGEGDGQTSLGPALAADAESLDHHGEHAAVGLGGTAGGYAHLERPAKIALIIGNLSLRLASPGFTVFRRGG
jgi:hypothetical protein